MTVKELYKWAIENNCVDNEIEIYDCDGGYYLSSTHDTHDPPEKIIYPSGYTVVRL